MKPPYIRTGTREEADAYAKSKGDWTVGSINQSIGWTEEPVIIEYAGRQFLLLPEDEKSLPAIAAVGEPEAARRAILELTSALTWSSVGKVSIEQWTGGSHMFRAGKGGPRGQMGAMHFQISYLPVATTSDQKLALALFQEGAGLAYTHVAYSFLSYYKIINLVSGHTGAAQTAWINARVDQIKHHRAQERLAELQKLGEDIGKYLYQSCRCAITHAGDPRNPVIDPHNPEDQKRLNSDLPLIVTLAEIAIEELGIQTSQTVYREHRYELSGFEEMLPADLVKQLKAGGTPADGGVELPDRFSIRMWGHSKYPPLENIKPRALFGFNGALAINCETNAPGQFANVVLDFPNYRLKVEIYGEDKDDGSAEFVEERMEIERFYFDWNGNGCLEVWAGDVCLGRCDAFIPVNMFLDHDAYEKNVAKLKAEIARRPRRGAVAAPSTDGAAQQAKT